MKAFVLIVGLAILGIGLFVGYGELRANDRVSTASCGAAFASKLDDAKKEDDRNAVLGPMRTHLYDICLEKIETRRTIAGAIAGLGAAVMLGGLAISGRR